MSILKTTLGVLFGAGVTAGILYGVRKYEAGKPQVAPVDPGVAPVAEPAPSDATAPAANTESVIPPGVDLSGLRTAEMPFERFEACIANLPRLDFEPEFKEDSHFGALTTHEIGLNPGERMVIYDMTNRRALAMGVVGGNLVAYQPEVSSPALRFQAPGDLIIGDVNYGSSGPVTVDIANAIFGSETLITVRPKAA